MASQQEVGDQPPVVQRVIARVELQARVVEQIRERAKAGDPSAPRVLNTTNPSADSLNIYVSLSAHTSDGRHILSEGPDFGIGGPRRGVGAIWHRYHGPPPLPEDPQEQIAFLENHHVRPADIEDGINQMLGRDPELHRPPRLSWSKLIKALAEHGIQVTDQDLINAPLTVELRPDVQAELDRR